MVRQVLTKWCTGHGQDLFVWLLPRLSSALRATRRRDCRPASSKGIPARIRHGADGRLRVSQSRLQKPDHIPLMAKQTLLRGLSY
jgi:hypothetical protein